MSRSSREGDGHNDSVVAYKATRMESVEEIRKVTGVQRISDGVLPARDDTAPFRPRYRSPVLLLCVLDDGREDGEWLRIRHSPFTIGRSEGELRLPHDEMLSGRHAQLSCVSHDGRHRWTLEDLDSTNGTFVRISRGLLGNNQEFLIGHRRFRFCLPGADVLQNGPESEAPGTRGWHALNVDSFSAKLLELSRHGVAREHSLTLAESWIGRDPQACSIALPDDATVSPKHARIHRDCDGHWHIENAGSRNGVWLRAEIIPIGRGGQFQLGEQRFMVRSK